MARQTTRRSERLLEIEGLTIGFRGQARAVVDDVSFTIARGETVAVVGESGSGKTITCRAALGILPRGAEIRAGRIRFEAPEGSVDLAAAPEPTLRKLRGDRLAMIFQEPMSALSPLHTVGSQTAEVLRLHRDLGGGEIKRRCLDAYARVGFPDPERAWRAYPFELSGGLRQRAMIAMAMVAEPDLLVADEPTTALDVTTQAQVLDLMKTLQAASGMGLALVTHDLGVVANMADRVVVMRKGRVVERGTTAEVIGDPRHGYTRRLIAAAPAIAGADTRGGSAQAADTGVDAVLELTSVSKTYAPRARGWKRARPIAALRGVDLVVPRGATTAIVGESGSGKSTLARIALAAERPDVGGRVRFRAAPGEAAVDLATLDAAGLKAFRRHAQMVMQDPYAALSPRLRVLDILCEPLDIHGVCSPSEARARAAALMSGVGLDPAMLERYPHAFSGGQRQRISIARALALEPALIVLDEPTSALDVSVQADILALLERLRDERGLTYLFISHNLAVVAALADRVVVMRAGRVVEEGPAEAVLQAPRHPYTRALLAASPEPDMARPIDLKAVAAGAGQPDDWPEPYGYDPAASDAPALVEVAAGHRVRRAA